MERKTPTAVTVYPCRECDAPLWYSREADLAVHIKRYHQHAPLSRDIHPREAVRVNGKWKLAERRTHGPHA